ncbi:zinc finger protein 62-like [Gouania willdenowi]|uniref:Zinc finger protein 62-like n=1 Tax=Gouania willdenowi TaxID=441366 RepID=A0A8C5HSW1_GOUWI|nr:zinc finger protein 62-like [Gouania willdenowi]
MAVLQGVREAIQNRLTAAADEIFVVFVQTVVQYEEEIERQRILLDAVLKPKVKLYREPAQQKHQTTEKPEVLPESQLCNQEGISTVDQEVSRSPQIKTEPEEVSQVWTCDFTEQLVQDQYTDGYTLTFSPRENEQVEDKTQNPDEPQSEAKEELEDISVQHFNSTAHSSLDYPSQLISHHPAQTAHGPDLTSNESLKEPEANSSGVLPFSSHMYGEASTSILTFPNNFHTDVGVKPHSCGICGKSFKKKSHLVIHHRVHTGERPYCCIVCGKSFRTTKNLNVHRKIHTGERPYSCDTCGKRFITNYKLGRHKKTHTTEKPYPCTFCGTTFRYMQTLKMHYRVHTDET